MLLMRLSYLTRYNEASVITTHDGFALRRAKGGHVEYRARGHRL